MHHDHDADTTVVSQPTARDPVVSWGALGLAAAVALSFPVAFLAVAYPSVAGAAVLALTGLVLAT